ncbi:hypothetical protein AYI87_04365 [Shewanella sp. KCT]|nr:hypothetical protein AYI87_04365 [Shewanella sp. KCT]
MDGSKDRGLAQRHFHREAGQAKAELTDRQDAIELQFLNTQGTVCGGALVQMFQAMGRRKHR